MRDGVCQRCGMILEEGISFCGRCGAAQAKQDTASKPQKPRPVPAPPPSMQGRPSMSSNQMQGRPPMPSNQMQGRPPMPMGQMQGRPPMPPPHIQLPMGQMPGNYGQAQLPAYAKSGVGFGQPQGGFGQPQAGFGQPQGGFGQPQGGFGQPQGGFGQPQDGFGQPQGGFGDMRPSPFSAQGVYGQQYAAEGGQPVIDAMSQEAPPSQNGPYAVISTGRWLGICLLLSIPLVNLVLLLVWAFGGCKRANQKNFARGCLIAAAILLAIQVVLGLLFWGSVVALLTEAIATEMTSGVALASFFF